MLQMLQKVPVGLLEAFNLKTQGQNPTLFGDTVYPFADVLEFYLQNRQFIASNSAGPAVFPQSIVQTLASGPNRLRGVAAFVTLTGAGPANAVYQAMISLTLPSSPGVSQVIADRNYQAPAAGFPAGFRLAVGGLLEQAYLLPLGGTIVATFLSSDAVGTSTIVANTIFESLSPLIVS
jgi:hypothetical protein